MTHCKPVRPSLASAFAFLSCVFWVFLAIRDVSAQGSVFSYQGSLNENGQSATGVYDFKFNLFGAAANGSPLASEVAVDDLGVTNGLFNVFLDFGAGAFDGSDRWLEISVRPGAATTAYTTLLPRQRIAASPMALQAASANALQSVALTALQAPVQQLQSRFDATNSLLLARLDSLTAALGTVLPSGITAASPIANDPALTILGYQEFAVLPAPTWQSGSAVNAPEARFDHTGIWTGSEFLVWGGRFANLVFSGTGYSYRPDTDQWSPISTIDAPSARARHTATWTGSEMIIWGGAGVSGYLNTGARFKNGVWRPMSKIPALAGREGHTAVWTGARFIIFGGLNSGGLLGDSFQYLPTVNVWAPVNASNPPTARRNATAVWTGNSVLVWGGEDDNGSCGDGAQLGFVGEGPNAWTPISNVNAPAPRTLHTAVWTGSKMIVWGGDNNNVPQGTGGIYDPATSTWTTISTTDAPAARRRHAALWTGVEMLIVGGETGAGPTALAHAYNPATDKWRPLTQLGNPAARSQAATVWSDSEILTFGGKSGALTIANLQRLNPQPAWRLYRKP